MDSAMGRISMGDHFSALNNQDPSGYTHRTQNRRYVFDTLDVWIRRALNLTSTINENVPSIKLAA